MSRTTTLTVVTVVTVALLMTTGPSMAADSSAWSVDASFGQSRFDDSIGTRHPQTFDDSSQATSLAVGYRVHRGIGTHLSTGHRV